MVIIKQDLHPIGEPTAVGFTSLEAVKKFAEASGKILIEDEYGNYLVIIIYSTSENVPTIAKYYKL